MAEFGGLQIEVRCVRCGRLPTADTTLFEMRNHLYICNFCRQEAEQKGKQIAWVGHRQFQQPGGALSSMPSTTIPLSPVSTRSLQSHLPPGSLFAMLELPVDSPVSKIADGIKRRMAEVMKQPDSAEKKQMILRLREWREKLQDELAFEAYRENLKSLSRGNESALIVGGKPVLTAQEFVDACEASREGWADGERYLRTGQLRQWIRFQLDDVDMATKARYYQMWTSVSDFHALNEMLYCFVPQRPFRLYSEEKWQPVSKPVNNDAVTILPTATTPEELAMLCDIHWNSGEKNLYQGSMVYWLEHSQGIAGLSAYYEACIAGYAGQWADRGVGLELLLERAVPGLAKPELEVTFDGHVGAYMQNRWDRELAHKPISVTVTNTTRGFTSIDLALQPPPNTLEPDWIQMAPATLRGRPGAGMPATKTITLMNLQQLSRGRKYQRMLTMSIRGEYGQPAKTEPPFPITLKTMWFFQGLRGILWTWGLRGGLPGLILNWAAGALLALLPFWLIPALVHTPDLSITATGLSFGAVLQEIVTGTLAAVQFLGPRFLLVVGAIVGFAGFCTGFGKGHANYTEKLSASTFRKWGFWLSLTFAIGLLFWDHGNDAISQAFQYGGDPYYGSRAILLAFLFSGGSLIIGTLIFLIACVIASIRYRLEEYLRKRYQTLLHPPERA